MSGSLQTKLALAAQLFSSRSHVSPPVHSNILKLMKSKYVRMARGRYEYCLAASTGSLFWGRIPQGHTSAQLGLPPPPDQVRQARWHCLDRVPHLSYLSHLQPGVDHALAHSDIPIVLKVTVSIAAGKGTEKFKHLAHFESNPIKGPTSLFTNYRYW